MVSLYETMNQGSNIQYPLQVHVTGKTNAVGSLQRLTGAVSFCEKVELFQIFCIGSSW